MGSLVPTVAVALGAKIVEKHFILSRAQGGVDSAFSMEPQEFREMVDNIRNVEKALGEVKYDITDRQRQKRRSLYAREDIHTGDTFTPQNVGSYRPGLGLSPQYWDELIGTRSKRIILRGDVLLESDINRVS